MKKAKIMLTTIAVIAAVGGAFAYKAYTTVNLYQCNCSIGTCSKLVVSDAVITPTGLFALANATTDVNKSCFVAADCGGTISYTFTE